MAPPNPINIKPLFGTSHVPCEGRVGDVIVMSPLQEDEPDFTDRGVASIWVCTRASYEPEGLPAVWIRLQAEGMGTCEYPASDPPQDIEILTLG
ncbi:MAG: hypothetical protein KC438_07080 [Thermomicrobiales bacterium]|nr:hypothetical protein [Thermomicrobiales bacterium]MCO5223304.1 hypothetical protein [Thermomicrobiales bacterium]